MQIVSLTSKVKIYLLLSEIKPLTQLQIPNMLLILLYKQALMPVRSILDKGPFQKTSLQG